MKKDAKKLVNKLADTTLGALVAQTRLKLKQDKAQDDSTSFAKVQTPFSSPTPCCIRSTLTILKQLAFEYEKQILANEIVHAIKSYGDSPQIVVLSCFIAAIGDTSSCELAARVCESLEVSLSSVEQERKMI